MAAAAPVQVPEAFLAFLAMPVTAAPDQGTPGDASDLDVLPHQAGLQDLQAYAISKFQAPWHLSSSLSADKQRIATKPTATASGDAPCVKRDHTWYSAASGCLYIFGFLSHNMSAGTSAVAWSP